LSSFFYLTGFRVDLYMTSILIFSYFQSPLAVADLTNLSPFFFILTDYPSIITLAQKINRRYKMSGMRIDGQSLIEEIKDEQWWKLVELKKFCIDKAVWHSGEKVGEVTERAQEYMDFLMGGANKAMAWVDYPHDPTGEAPRGFMTMQDYKEKIERDRADYEMRVNGKPPTNTEHEKVLDLERIADNEPLCWSIFVICHEGFYYMHNIDIRIYDSMLDLYVENGNNDLLVRIFNDGIIHLFKQSEIIPIINEHLEKFLEPYWIDKE